ncbi:MAG: YcxB family protein [Emticicia sp.]
MEDFTIKTRLTTKEYTRVMYVGLYKKPVFIFATLLGLYLLTPVLLDYLKVINYYTDMPIYDIVIGTFLLLAPSVIVLISISQFRSNPSFQNEMTYTFSDRGVAVKGLTFNSDFLWSHIIKQKELGKFLILYHSKKFGNFIDMTTLTEEQLEFIKSRVGSK